jgi:hypothetical protein
LPGGVADHQGLASATVGVPTVLLLRLRCDGLPDHQTRDLHLLAVVAVVLALEAADVDEPLAVGSATTALPSALYATPVSVTW